MKSLQQHQSCQFFNIWVIAWFAEGKINSYLIPSIFVTDGESKTFQQEGIKIFLIS